MKIRHSHSAIQKYENCPRSYWYERISKQVKDEGNKYSKKGIAVHTALEHRLKSGKKLPDELGKLEKTCARICATKGKLLPEHKMSLSVDLSPTDWDGKDMWIRGIADVLLIYKDTATIMDWKTGKRKDSFSQLELLTLLTFKHFPKVRKVTAGFFWIKENKVDEKKYTKDDENGLWQSWLPRIHRIHRSYRDDVWPHKPSGLCSYCAARFICPVSHVRGY